MCLNPPYKRAARYWRRCPDPLAAVGSELRGWFEAEPWRTGRELLERLQAAYPGAYPDALLRTVQRRLKGWRREMAQKMVFGAVDTAEMNESGAGTPGLRS